MKRPWGIWTAFAVCASLAALALFWLGRTALALEASQARLRQQAALDESVQLALWRMDSALATLVSDEAARPYFHYSAFYPTERAYTHMLEPLNKGDVLVASPLLTEESPRVRLHFQYGPSGQLESPQVPQGNMRDLAETRYVASATLEESARLLDALRSHVSMPAMEMACAIDASNPRFAASLLPEIPRLVEGPQAQTRGPREWQMRILNAQKVQVSQQERGPVADLSQIRQQHMQGAWINGILVLARRVRVGDSEFLQGCWLDWEAIRTELLASVADLVPGARLEPSGQVDQAVTRRLAALPAVLDVPDFAPRSVRGWTPVRLSLLIAWGALAAASIAIGFVLASALALSERRGTFVSAVTHELRTPLTSFRLYSDMLAAGMVHDEPKRREYLATLQRQADRLAHLVENVLLFARLERGRRITRNDVLTTTQLLSRVTPGLESRAAAGGMGFEVSNSCADLRLRTDVSIVEQILLNLVDNASKYARGAADNRVELHMGQTGASCTIAVVDHGPGLPRAALRRLFRPFSKSDHEAAQSGPGVGLGLALSRRLARSIQGDLRLESSGPEGARFVLLLPVEARGAADGLATAGR